MGGFQKGVEVILGEIEVRVGDLVLGEDGEAMLADQEVRDVFLELLFRSFKHDQSMISQWPVFLEPTRRMR